MKKLKKTLDEIWSFRNKIVHWFWEDQDEYWYIRTSNTQYWEDWIVVEQLKILNKDLRKYNELISRVRLNVDNIAETFYQIMN